MNERTRLSGRRLIHKSMLALTFAAIFWIRPDAAMARDTKYDQGFNVAQANKQGWAASFASMARNAKPACAFNYVGIPWTNADVGHLSAYFSGMNLCNFARQYSSVADAIWRSYLNDRNPVYVRIYEYKSNRSLRFDICTLYVQVGNKWVGGGFEYNTSGGSCMYAK